MPTFISNCVRLIKKYLKLKKVFFVFNETTDLKLTLAIQWRSGKIAVRDVDGSREVAEVSECVNVSL